MPYFKTKYSRLLILFLVLSQGCGNSKPAGSETLTSQNVAPTQQVQENLEAEDNKNSSTKTEPVTAQLAAVERNINQTIEFVNNFNEDTPLDKTLQLDVDVLIALVDPEKEGVSDKIRLSSNANSQRNAIMIIEMIGQAEQALPALLTAATYSKEGRVCDAIDNTLRRLDPAKIAQPVVEQLSVEWDHLSRKSPPDILGPIVMDLGHYDLNYLLKVINRETDVIPEVRDFVKLAASGAGPKAKTVIPELIELLESTRVSFAVSKLLIPEALVKIGADDPQTIAALTRIISESADRQLQQAAFDALKQLSPEAAVNSGFLDKKK